MYSYASSRQSAVHLKILQCRRVSQSDFWQSADMLPENFTQKPTLYQANTFIESWWWCVLFYCVSYFEQSTYWCLFYCALYLEQSIYWCHFCFVTSVISLPHQDSSVPVNISYDSNVFLCLQMVDPAVNFYLCHFKQCNVTAITLLAYSARVHDWGMCNVTYYALSINTTIINSNAM